MYRNTEITTLKMQDSEKAEGKLFRYVFVSLVWRKTADTPQVFRFVQRLNFIKIENEKLIWSNYDVYSRKRENVI